MLTPLCWHYMFHMNHRQSENNRITHLQDSSGPGWWWPEFRGHKPLEKGAIRQWGHLTLTWSEGRFQSCIDYLLMASSGPGTVLHAAAVLSPGEGMVSSFPGLLWASVQQFAKLFHREGGRWSTAVVPRSLASKAPLFGGINGHAHVGWGRRRRAFWPTRLSSPFIIGEPLGTPTVC